MRGPTESGESKVNLEDQGELALSLMIQQDYHGYENLKHVLENAH